MKFCIPYFHQMKAKHHFKENNEQIQKKNQIRKFLLFLDRKYSSSYLQ